MAAGEEEARCVRRIKRAGLPIHRLFLRLATKSLVGGGISESVRLKIAAGSGRSSAASRMAVSQNAN